MAASSGSGWLRVETRPGGNDKKIIYYLTALLQRVKRAMLLKATTRDATPRTVLSKLKRSWLRYGNDANGISVKTFVARCLRNHPCGPYSFQISQFEIASLNFSNIIDNERKNYGDVSMSSTPKQQPFLKLPPH